VPLTGTPRKLKHAAAWDAVLNAFGGARGHDERLETCGGA